MALDYGTIGQRIAARRKALGLKQVQVCERCDINSNYLSNIERAKSIPSLEVFVRICQALDVTPDELLAGTVRREEPEEWKNVAEKLRGMSREQLALADSFLSWVSERG
ncbi:XRE family transcriptional regulator [Pseudoflavonifractor sp. AF19-9AC]|uniref:helix-turn-helix domain-containing protein n=1 Tax=Pseudoflavonifractor sp. AF19-9AC TaxID=2292244 RepID=UPI000E4EFEF6|nr:helix-turn-helix transcriptional regulator [Pseudoflavonifractor sp. AF19-9AC]RHR10563.1 XRE family transcriptional regulator [Pseudoflavonifractor sp. AF19-9AC]